MGYHTILSLIVLILSSRGCCWAGFGWAANTGWGVGVANRFPWPPALPTKGLALIGNGCEMVVLFRWLWIGLVGELSIAVLSAVHCSRRLSCTWTFSSLAVSSLYLCTPSLMCPSSTALIAFVNVAQSAWFLGIFSCKTPGRLSCDSARARLAVLSIFACFARSRTFSAKTMCVYTSSPLYFSVFPRFSTLILIPANSLSSSNLVFFIFSTFGNHCLKLCLKSVYLFFGVAASLNHSSAGELDFSHKPTVVIFCSSVGIIPELIKLRLIIFRNSMGWMESSCVPENSVIFMCWLIASSHVERGGLGKGVGCNGGSKGDGGSSEIDSISDRVVEDGQDSKSEDAVGDDMVVVNGVMVLAHGHAEKRLLRCGWSFQARVIAIDYWVFTRGEAWLCFQKFVCTLNSAAVDLGSRLREEALDVLKYRCHSHHQDGVVPALLTPRISCGNEMMILVSICGYLYVI